MARSITRAAMSGTTILAALIMSRAALLPSRSILSAVRSVSSRACSMSQKLRAMSSFTEPCSPSARPKAWRLVARRHISSSARWAQPISRMQWWMRPGPSRPWAISKPRPSPSSMWSSGTRTLS